MEGLAVLAFFAVFIFIAIIIRVAAGSMDGDRLAQYIAQRGGHLLTKQWTPFGPGWFGEKNARIYEITYRDTEGNVHRASVKTSALAGVYLTEDRIIERVKMEQTPYARPAATPSHAPIAADRMAELEEENRRLREEIERLRNERDYM